MGVFYDALTPDAPCELHRKSFHFQTDFKTSHEGFVLFSIKNSIAFATRAGLAGCRGVNKKCGLAEGSMSLTWDLRG